MGKHTGAQKRGVVASCQLHEPFCWSSKMPQSRKFRASLRGFSRQLKGMLHRASSLCCFDAKWAACAPGCDILLAVAYTFNNSSFIIQVRRKGFIQSRKISAKFVSLPAGMKTELSKIFRGVGRMRRGLKKCLLSWNRQNLIVKALTWNAAKAPTTYHTNSR